MIRSAFFLFAFVVATFSLPLESDTFHSVNNQYYISKISLEFLQAYAHCKIHGLSLAVESSAEETSAIEAAIKKVGATSSYFWLGGFYQNGGSFYPEWIWLDSGKRIEYSKWLSSTNTGTSPCFIKMPTASTGKGNWTTNACTNKYTFICK